MLIFPKELPTARFGVEFQPVDPQLRSQMQNGRTMVRRAFTATPVNFEASWILSDEQAVIFESFYRTHLEDGTKWFKMKLSAPSGLKLDTVRFIGIYKNKRLAPNIWTYKAKMQKYLRDDIPQPLDKNVYRILETGDYRI